MNGKRVVITGATAGIGKAAAIELARRGADLAMVVRNPAKASAVVEEIKAEAPGVHIDVFRADLSDLDQVRTVGAELVDALDRIDVLVNNAGLAASHPRTTVDGYDEMLAANYLGPFLLTHLLLDAIRASAPARIVIVASEAHRYAGRVDPEHFEDLGTYALSGQRAYGRTKLFDLLFATELGRRLDGTGVTVNSLCPGFVATELVREQAWLQPAMGLLAKTPFVRTPEQGAEMIVHLACSPEVAGETGRFFSSTPGARLVPPVAARGNAALMRRLYERTAELVGVEATSEGVTRSGRR